MALNNLPDDVLSIICYYVGEGVCDIWMYHVIAMVSKKFRKIVSVAIYCDQYGALIDKEYALCRFRDAPCNYENVKRSLTQIDPPSYSKYISVYKYPQLLLELYNHHLLSKNYINNNILIYACRSNKYEILKIFVVHKDFAQITKIRILTSCLVNIDEIIRQNIICINDEFIWKVMIVNNLFDMLCHIMKIWIECKGNILIPQFELIIKLDQYHVFSRICACYWQMIAQNISDIQLMINLHDSRKISQILYHNLAQQLG